MIGEVSLAVVRVRWGFASEDRRRGSAIGLELRFGVGTG